MTNSVRQKRNMTKENEDIYIFLTSYLSRGIIYLVARVLSDKYLYINQQRIKRASNLHCNFRQNYLHLIDAFYCQ